MRWLSALLAVVGIAQYTVLAILQPDDYVSLDMAYLVMALFLLAAAGVWCCSWCSWGGHGYGCDCCGDDCRCGDCECCEPDDAKPAAANVEMKRTRSR